MKDPKEKQSSHEQGATHISESLKKPSQITMFQLRKQFSDKLNAARDGEYFEVSRNENLVALLGPANAVETVRIISRTALRKILPEFLSDLAEEGPVLILHDRKREDLGALLKAPSREQFLIFQKQVLEKRQKGNEVRERSEHPNKPTENDPEKMVKTVGKKIQELRKKAGFSQSQLARKMNVTLTWVQHLEQKGSNIQLITMVNLGNILHIHPSAFLEPLDEA